MDASAKFARFAVECETMAKFAASAENSAVWERMAERWRRCAELYDYENSRAHQAQLTKRHRSRPHTWAP